MYPNSSANMTTQLTNFPVPVGGFLFLSGVIGFHKNVFRPLHNSNKPFKFETGEERMCENVKFFVT
jgi:hypothetical protein